MRFTGFALGALFVTAASACGSDGHEARGGPATPAELVPSDLSTGTGALVPALNLPLGSHTKPTGLTLVTWPEGAVVETAMTGGMGQWTLAPARPLDARWYALRLSPGDYDFAVQRGGHFTADGSVVARFRPDHHPRVNTLTACDKRDGIWSLTMAFSELVEPMADATFESAISIEQEGATCKSPRPTGVDAAPSYYCSGFDPEKPLVVTLHGGALSASGVAVAHASYALVRADFTRWGECQRAKLAPDP